MPNNSALPVNDMCPGGVDSGTRPLTELRRDFDDWADNIRRKMEEDESYRGPIELFLKSASKMKTDSALQFWQKCTELHKSASQGLANTKHN